MKNGKGQKGKEEKKGVPEKKGLSSPSFGENKKTMSPQPEAAGGMTNNAKLGKYILRRMGRRKLHLGLYDHQEQRDALVRNL